MGRWTPSPKFIRESSSLFSRLAEADQMLAGIPDCAPRKTSPFLCWVTLFSAILGGPLVWAAQGVDLERGLLGRWKFEGDASDSSGSGNDGILKDAPMFADGKIGQALRLNGRGQFVEVPKLATQIRQFTIAVWIHVHRMPAPKAFASIYHNNGWQVGDVHLPFAGEKGVIDLGIKGNEPSMSIPSFEVKELQGRWAHLVATYNADDKKEVRFYLDGQLKDVFQIELANPVNLGPGRIGAWDDEGRWFNGVIDEVYIYEQALKGREVRALFELAPKEK